MRKAKFLFLLVLIFLSAKLITAQPKTEGLVINEVYLDKNKSQNSWVEIYNPTKEALFLEKFSMSMIGPANLLDNSLIKNGGIKLDPNGYILLCCIQNETWKNKENVYKVKYLSLLGRGGIITIKTKGKGLEGVDILRYGNPSLTAWKGISDKQVIPLSTNGKSYSRKNNLKNLGKAFYESALTPLELNK